MNRVRSLRFGLSCIGPLVALAVAPAPAHAQFPWIPNCSVEARLVSCPLGDPLPGCAANLFPEPGFRVIVRDMVNIPLPNVPVSLVFTSPAIRIHPDGTPGTTINCANRSITRLTDAAGSVNFAPRIGGTAVGPTVRVEAQGFLLSVVEVTTTDVTGDGFTGLGDFSILVANYLARSPDRRTDLDSCVHPVDGATTLADIGIFATQFGKPIPANACP